MKNILLIAGIASLLVACGQTETSAPAAAPAADIAFTDDEDRVLYALGVALGENIADFRLTDEELAFVTAGIRDVVADVPYRVDMELYGVQIQRLANERLSLALEEEKAASANFAAEVAAEPGAETFPSGLVLVPITEGDGANPTADDRVTVHYHGTLRDGSVFDSSVDRGEPATFQLRGVIACWTEGVQKIKVGGKAKLLCPSPIAYGDNGPPGIPGGAALLFEVELLSIE